jgi:RNA polymerase sigma factor (sigma-70 family)
MAVSNDNYDDLLAIDEALSRLEAVDARKAKIVELRYFGGLSIDEIAEQLDISESTILRDLRTAEAWLNRSLRQA